MSSTEASLQLAQTSEQSLTQPQYSGIIEAPSPSSSSMASPTEQLLSAETLSLINKSYYQKVASYIEKGMVIPLEQLLDRRPVSQLEINRSQYFDQEPLLTKAIRTKNIKLVNLLISCSLPPSPAIHGPLWNCYIELWPLYKAMVKGYYDISYALFKYYPIHQFLAYYALLSQQLSKTNCALLHLSESFRLEDIQTMNSLTSNHYLCILANNRLYVFERANKSIKMVRTNSYYYNLLKERVERLPFDQELQASFEETSYLEKLTHYSILKTDIDYLSHLTNQLDAIHYQKNTDSDDLRITNTLKFLKRLYPSSLDCDESFDLLLRFSFLPKIDSTNASSLLKPLIKTIENCAHFNFIRSILHLLNKIGHNFLLMPWESYPSLASYLFNQFRETGHVELVKAFLNYLDASTRQILNLPKHLLDEWHKNPNHTLLDALLVRSFPEIKDRKSTSGPAFFQQVADLQNEIELLRQEKNQKPSSSSSEPSAPDPFESFMSEDDNEITPNWRGRR